MVSRQGESARGLTLDPIGAIIGAPAVAVRFPFAVTATDIEARSGSVEATLVVAKKLSSESRS